MWDKIKLKQTNDHHCEVSMQERNVTTYHLMATVTVYDNWDIQENGRYMLSKRFGNTVLDVIVSATTSANCTIGRVVTAFPKGKGKMGFITTTTL